MKIEVLFIGGVLFVALVIAFIVFRRNEKEFNSWLLNEEDSNT